MSNIRIFLCVCVAIALASCGEGTKNRDLSIWGPKGLDEAGDTVYHSVGDFKFINHKGESIVRNDFNNQVYVANFFFATCPEICPKMQNQMRRVQEAYKNTDKLRLISHTVNPVQDTVEALAAYAEELDIYDRWDLVTGDKKEIYDLARQGYFVTTLDGDGGKSDFIHSDKLVLVDAQGRIRGYYIGLDSVAVDQLIVDIWKLIQPEKRKI